MHIEEITKVKILEKLIKSKLNGFFNFNGSNIDTVNRPKQKDCIDKIYANLRYIMVKVLNLLFICHDFDLPTLERIIADIFSLNPPFFHCFVILSKTQLQGRILKQIQNPQVEHRSGNIRADFLLKTNAIKTSVLYFKIAKFRPVSLAVYTASYSGMWVHFNQTKQNQHFQLHFHLNKPITHKKIQCLIIQLNFKIILLYKLQVIYQQNQLKIEIKHMNKDEAVRQKIKVEKFMENNKVRPLFHELTKLLLLKKPEDPIQFLVDYLDKRNKKQIVSLLGYDEQNRVKLAKNISNKFNYKIIELAQLFKGVADWNSKSDKQINDKVFAQLNKVQSVYKGIIISGYPNNIVQADFIQKSGILPERYFLMGNDQNTIRKSYEQKYEGNIDKIVQRNRLQLKELNQILGDQIDFLPLQIEKSTQKIVQTLSIKANKKSVPFDSLKVVVLYPPYLKPEASDFLIDSFSLNPISVNATLKKLSNKQGFITHVESYIRKHNCISKEIELAMIETMTKNATSKNKGFALYGWPEKKDRIPLLKEHFLNPHLILVFDQNKQKSLLKFEKMNPDDSNIFSINKKPSKEQYQKKYDDYQQMLDALKGKSNVQVFSHDQTPQKVTSTFINLIENPKIYS